MSLTFKGSRELIKKLKRLDPKESARRYRKIVRDATKPVLLEVKKNSPTGPTGTLRDSWNTKVKHIKIDNTFIGKINTKKSRNIDGWYAHFVEFGTREHGPKKAQFLKFQGVRAKTVKGQMGKHILEKAFKANEQAMIQGLADGIKKTLARL